jgi:hypothetical protein
MTSTTDHGHARGTADSSRPAHQGRRRSPAGFLHFLISLLCHDIGYVRGICRDDRDSRYVINLSGGTIALPEGSTDAALTPHHVSRSKLFVRERFGKLGLSHINSSQIEANIENTRFPVPQDEQHAATADFPGRLRAADLIGQLADIDYLRKTPALFTEFRETGISDSLGYSSAADLRANYPKFFWNEVRPFIGDALSYLRVTQEGKGSRISTPTCSRPNIKGSTSNWRARSTRLLLQRSLYFGPQLHTHVRKFYIARLVGGRTPNVSGLERALPSKSQDRRIALWRCGGGSPTIGPLRRAEH